MDKLILIISAFGAGGLLTAYLQSLLDRRKRVEEKEHDFKLKRYGCIILLMQARLHWDDDKAFLRIHRPELKDVNDLHQELKTELFNAILFASESVIKTFSQFIKIPTCETFVEASSEMRQDLWGKSSKLKKANLLIADFVLPPAKELLQSGGGVERWGNK